MTRWACAWDVRGKAGVRIGGVHAAGPGAWRAWMSSSDVGPAGGYVVSKAGFDLPPGTEDDAIRYVRDVLLPAFVAQGLEIGDVHELRTDDHAEAVRVLVEAGAHDVVKALILERDPHEVVLPEEVERLAGYAPRPKRDAAKAVARLARKRKSAGGDQRQAGREGDPFGAARWQAGQPAPATKGRTRPTRR